MKDVELSSLGYNSNNKKPVSQINQDSIKRVQYYLNEYGMLLLNENKLFPSVEGVGGDWDAIMYLIEQREAFLCKVFKNRTTYLSKELYYCLKNYKNDKPLNETERRIFDFLSEGSGFESNIIKGSLLLSSKEFKESMDSLLKKMYITVLGRGKTLNKQWSTYIWGTYQQWEASSDYDAKVDEMKDIENKITNILSKNMTDKQIKSFLNLLS